MSRGARISIAVLIVAVLAATVGCTKALDYFKEKHPDPPTGAFPPRVGKMVVEENDRWGKNPNCTRADPLHCWGYYVDPGGDSEMTRIHYYMQIYDSQDEANARLEAYAGEQVPWEQQVIWEDRMNMEGQKAGRLLIRNSLHLEDDHLLGTCSVSYSKDAWFITIYHGYECEPSREFFKDLTAITDP